MEKAPAIWMGVVPAFMSNKFPGEETSVLLNDGCDSYRAKCGSANPCMHVGAASSWHAVLRKSQQMCSKWHIFKAFVRQRDREAARSAVGEGVDIFVRM